jgi:hypothetical protein
VLHYGYCGIFGFADGRLWDILPPFGFPVFSNRAETPAIGPDNFDRRRLGGNIIAGDN